MISWNFKKVVKLARYTHNHVRTCGTDDNMEYDFMLLVVNMLELPFYNLPKY